MEGNDLFKVVSQRLTHADTVKMVRHALAQGVVLDTWMNGENEEQVSEDAQIALISATEQWTSEALLTGAIFPNHQMPEQYVRSAFHEVLFSTALYVAQNKKGRLEVALPEVDEAIERLSNFIAHEPRKLTVVGDFFFIVSSHEDLNAIAYYGRMKTEDFLLGRFHRPWSNIVLNPSLILYQQLDLVESRFGGESAMLSLSQRGHEVLAWLRDILSDAGELKWRSENQRWVIFGETDYDTVHRHIFPVTDKNERKYLERLGIQSGMRVLEVGAGTGRVTVDLGLCDLVGPTGSVVALDPTAALLSKLTSKCGKRDIKNVEIVQGVAENLPFPNDEFDAAIAVKTLHFTDIAKSVAEMVRVTKPGGFVSALNPPPEFNMREIPIVALWFRPLTSLAEDLGLPFTEHNGLPVGLTKAIFEKYLKDIKVWDVPALVSAEEYQSFLAFFLKGAALFQNIFSRLPYQERWDIIRRLERDGAEIAAHTSKEEKSHLYFQEAVYGRVPVKILPPR